MNLIGKIKLVLIGGLLMLAVSLPLSDTAVPSSTNLYNLKRLQEKIFMAVRLNPEEKVKYNLFLLDKRLSELAYLVENRQFDYILTSSLRYSTTAGQATELIISHEVTALVGPAKEKFVAHQKVIQALYNSYPHDENDKGKFIQDDYNYLNIYLDKLSDK